MIIQKEIFWFEISVHNTFVMEVSEGFKNTTSVETSSCVIERASEIKIYGTMQMYIYWSGPALFAYAMIEDANNAGPRRYAHWRSHHENILIYFPPLKPHFI